jgi:hypothetical protein
MSKPESLLTDKIIGVLRKRYPGSFWVKIHGSNMQHGGLPDLHGILHGHAVWLEVKMPEKRATDLQQHVIEQIVAAGGLAGVVYSVEDAAALCDELDPRYRLRPG